MISADVMKILTEESNSFVQKVRGNITSTGTNATGKTSDSIRYEVTENGNKIILEFFGREYFATVETGRKPTPDKKPSRTMIENITEWVNAKGIPESAVWGIATNIQKQGTALFRKGGRTDIYTDEAETFTDELFSAVTEQIANEFFEKATLSFER